MTIKLTRDHDGYKKDQVVSLDYDTETRWKAEGIAVNSPTAGGILAGNDRDSYQGDSARNPAYRDSAGYAGDAGRAGNMGDAGYGTGGSVGGDTRDARFYTDNGKPYQAPVSPSKYTMDGTHFFTVRDATEVDAETYARVARERAVAESKERQRVAEIRAAAANPGTSKYVVVVDERGKEEVMTRLQFRAAYRADHVPGEPVVYQTAELPKPAAVGGTYGKEATVRDSAGRVVSDAYRAERDAAGNPVRRDGTSPTGDGIERDATGKPIYRDGVSSPDRDPRQARRDSAGNVIA